MRRFLPLSVLALAVAAAGCGGSGGDGQSTSGETTTAAETTFVDTTATDTTTGTTAKVVTITVKDAAPVGGIVRASVDKGDKVTLVIHSDVADEIHVHGYDLMKDVEAGGTVRITFVATLPGRFEAELEDHAAQIAELTVNP